MFLMIRGRPHLTRALDYSIAALILLNVLATTLETVAGIEARFGRVLHAFDLFSVVVFTIEYGVRLALCPAHPSGRFLDPVRGRLRYALTPMAIIDLLAILPFYLGIFTAVDLRFLRVLRLFRVFKLTRYSAAMSILLSVLREEAPSFGASLFILCVILILAASGMYLVEQDAQPDAFGSIPAAMWWAVATLTTVGYGDVTPLTTVGKLFGALVTVVGIGMVALPAGILASAFSDHLRKRRESFQRQVTLALEDGTISAGERDKLDAVRQELGLATEEAKRLVVDARAAACPHCGKTLGSA
jgi:voltage-gated potassium channel